MKRMSEIRLRACAAGFSLLMALACPLRAQADDYDRVNGPGLIPGQYVAIAKEPKTDIYVSMDSYDILKEAQAGEYFHIIGDEGGGWMEVYVGSDKGFLSEEDVSIVEAAELEASEQEEAMEAQPQTGLEGLSESRRQVVNYAMQFLGCRYRYGGNDPRTGVDCSGFTRFVMSNAAGVYLERTSRAQATQGVSVGEDQMRPGDLIFYGKGGGVNHVALYIGNGQIIHASTEKTGVKISRWNYRSPLRIANVLGD